MTEEISDLECVSIISGLLSCSINFLAIDFDLTLVDEHTRGDYGGSAASLCQRVRPFFRALIPMALSRGRQMYPSNGF